HGALLLGWASYIKEIETIDIIKHAEKGIKLKGIQFFKNMLDREQEQFPFNGHELNIEGYRSVVKEVISNILGLFNIRKSPFKLLKDILDSIEIVLLPSPLVLDYSLNEQFFKEDLRTFPFIELYNFLRDLF